jgi:predicted HicB family RNase H-like nuclease
LLYACYQLNTSNQLSFGDVKKMKNKFIQIRVSEGKHEEITELARKAELTVSAYILRFLNSEINKNKQTQGGEPTTIKSGVLSDYL